MWKWYFAEPCCAYTLQRASWLLPITDHNLDQLDEVRDIIVVIIMVNNITIIIKWSVWPSSIHHKNPSKCTLSKSDKACILSKPSNFYLAMVTIGMWFVGGRRLQRRVFIFFYQHITHRSLAEQFWKLHNHPLVMMIPIQYRLCHLRFIIILIWFCILSYKRRWWIIAVIRFRFISNFTFSLGGR